MSLISRYVLRECFGACLIVMAVLFIILMGNQFAEILGDAAANQLPREAVFSVLGLTTLRYLTLLAPIGLFLGTLWALARLSRDSEMAALGACGVGPTRLLWPIGVLTVILAVIATWLVLVQTPAAMREIATIRDQARQAMQVSAIEPGRFTSPDSGDTVLYASAVEGNQLRGVFVERQHDGRVIAIRADHGERVKDPKTGAVTFVLHDGIRYEGIPGEKQFSIVKFGEQGIPVLAKPGKDDEPSPETKPTTELFASNTIADRAELERRLSTPISLFVLAVFAVVLSRSSPREGQSMRAGMGLLIYILYFNALSVGLVWLRQERLPVWLGVWWIHAVFGVVAIAWLGRQAGWFRRAPRVEHAA